MRCSLLIPGIGHSRNNVENAASDLKAHFLFTVLMAYLSSSELVTDPQVPDPGSYLIQRVKHHVSRGCYWLSFPLNFILTGYKMNLLISFSFLACIVLLL